MRCMETCPAIVRLLAEKVGPPNHPASLPASPIPVPVLSSMRARVLLGAEIIFVTQMRFTYMACILFDPVDEQVTFIFLTCWPTYVKLFSLRVLQISTAVLPLYPLTSKRRWSLEGCSPARVVPVVRPREFSRQRSVRVRPYTRPAFFDMLARSAAEKCGGYEPRTADDCRR